MSLGGIVSSVASATGLDQLVGGAERALTPGRFNADTYAIKGKRFKQDPRVMKQIASGLQDKHLGRINVARTDIDMNQANQLRTNQANLIGRLEAAEAGTGGPSLAQLQLRQATDRGLAQQMAMAASMGGNAGGLRQLGQQSAATNQQAAMQSAQTRMAEQLAARQELAGAIQSGRQQDIGLATDQAQLLTQQRLANQQSALQNRGMKLQNRQALANLRLQGEGQRLGSMTDLEKLRVQQNLGIEGIEAGAFAARETAKSANLKSGIGAVGDMGSAAAAAGLFSDKRLKTDIKGGEKSLAKFLSSIKSEEYTYKDKKHGAGKYVSPMAQDLEKTELGKHMVINTPAGKMVNYGRAAGLLLSANAMLHKKVNQLEKSMKR